MPEEADLLGGSGSSRSPPSAEHVAATAQSGLAQVNLRPSKEITSQQHLLINTVLRRGARSHKGMAGADRPASLLAAIGSTLRLVSVPNTANHTFPNTKIGIAAGVPCGVLVIAGVIGAYFLGQRRATKKTAAAPQSGIEYPYEQGPYGNEIDGDEIRRQELETKVNRAELPEKTGRDYHCIR
ncbi:hypothetical protein K469DRAFT_279015 [Zopfia rhizophila CBS 207.26]|uniref:Uncharacterized protein n=1 Tax=Zopfia rhizophila CBS 207.26 TaxID=1314779 RepID=A0A6A6DQD4_9PEZI|nr:hypothetical protein K469DRAFT_279015 [Zopfia rhizophila CBS 207.26]